MHRQGKTHDSRFHFRILGYRTHTFILPSAANMLSSMQKPAKGIFDIDQHIINYLFVICGFKECDFFQTIHMAWVGVSFCWILDTVI